MSPGHTFERVYDTLKRQIMIGQHRPGERLDPARLAFELNASTTPVRDALHRLLGERLVTTWPGEGFRAPVHSEPELRDLYGWNLDLVEAVLRSRRRTPVQIRNCDTPALAVSAAADPAGRAADLFRGISLLSSNLEHHLALQNASERLHFIRLMEANAFDALDDELTAIEAALPAGELDLLKKLLLAYHRRRLANVPMLIATMRLNPRAT